LQFQVKTPSWAIFDIIAKLVANGTFSGGKNKNLIGI
jgi:hypothetical protein